MRGVGQLEDKPGLRGDREGHLAGEELRDIEADEAVGADRLRGRGERAQAGMEGEGLAREPVELVLDGSAGDPEGSAEGADAG